MKFIIHLPILVYRRKKVIESDVYREGMTLTADDVLESDVPMKKDLKTGESSEVCEKISELTKKDIIDSVGMPFYIPENLLFDLTVLNNSYYVLRHGESVANLRGIIVSNKTVATNGYGLTEKGRGQVLRNTEGAGFLDKDTVVISSDYLRAVETAKIFIKAKKIPRIQIAAALRERGFGRLEMESADEYKNIWEEDAKDYTHKTGGVESVAEVTKRVTSYIKRLEKRYKGKKIVLVGHGDVLQIMEAAFKKMNPAKHRSLKHLDNGELRELWINPLNLIH